MRKEEEESDQTKIETEGKEKWSANRPEKSGVLRDNHFQIRYEPYRQVEPDELSVMQNLWKP